jgi:hypothetical protein
LAISGQELTPRGHTEDSGVVVGDAGAHMELVVFEDPQCPYCRQFEEINGSLIAAEVARGDLAVEYRMRCFLGPESVRADNALVLAAEAGHFDELRRELFAHQPAEGAGGFTIDDLLQFGSHVGLQEPSFVSGVREARYGQWVLSRESRFDSEDPQGTPAAWLNGEAIDANVLFSSRAFARLLRP